MKWFAGRPREERKVDKTGWGGVGAVFRGKIRVARSAGMKQMMMMRIFVFWLTANRVIWPANL